MDQDTFEDGIDFFWVKKGPNTFSDTLDDE
jgi:hypothetical protein